MEFRELKSILTTDPKTGLTITGRHLIPQQNLPAKEIPQLKHYTDSAENYIKHNLAWAKGKTAKPKFKFAYLELPIPCNLHCMGCFKGQDKKSFVKTKNNKVISDQQLAEIINFLKSHSAEAIIYAAEGELFCWPNAFEYIKRITDAGLSMMIFTNGTLLSKEDIDWLNEKKISLTFSLRDTTESGHNNAVKSQNAFRKTLQALDWALQIGMHNDNRLSVEIPATKDNAERIINDFIPAMRSLGVIPLAEEYIQIMTSDDEKRLCHNFSEAREFFKKATEIDAKLGFVHQLEFGQRMLAQPKCERQLYSFNISVRSGEVMNCPSGSVKYGNFFKNSLTQIIYSDLFKAALNKFTLCPCSTFFTATDQEIPKQLPQHLINLR